MQTSTNVYAVFDCEDSKLYQFGAPETVLAKDAVLAFIEENGPALFGCEADKELLQSEVSKTGSIEELSNLLHAYDFVLSVIQIKGN